MRMILIGYRGCGKSTIGVALAERLQVPWVDADEYLETQAGRSIKDIFATDGEPTFRAMERACLVELLERDPLVLSAGGGAILNPQTREDFRIAGFVVWLMADVATIADRIAGDATTAARRPNLTAAGGIDEIRALLNVREPLYRETAHLTVATEGRSVTEIVDQIVAHLPRSTAS